MVEIDITYEGRLHTKCVHAPTRKSLATDAPKDNYGLGEEFSPTDLLAASLGSCMLTVMGIYAQNHGIELKGMTAKVVKEMTLPPQERACRLHVEIYCPIVIAPEMRERLEKAAGNCPVQKSLREDAVKEVKFIWKDPS